MEHQVQQLLSPDAAENNLITQVMAGVDVSRRVIYLTGEIVANLAHRVIILLEFLDSSDGEIRIVLNSPGGEEQAGYAIYDAIRNCDNQVTVDGYGDICSIAAAIFQAGDTRRLAAHSSFMIHDGTGPSTEDMKLQEIEDMADTIKKWKRRYYRILGERSRLSEKKIEEMCKHDTYLLPEEALKYGFADEVIKPKCDRVKPTRIKKAT